MISIARMDESTRQHFNQMDSRCLVGERITLSVRPGGFMLSYKPLPKAEWLAFPPYAGMSADGLLKEDNAACYLAFMEGKPAGQMVAFENEYALAVIDDMRVDVRFRRSGIGKVFIETVTEWAIKRGLKGITAQTQDSNPQACQFFEACGMKLGGVDRCLLRGITDPAAARVGIFDTALFFYRFF